MACTDAIVAAAWATGRESTCTLGQFGVSKVKRARAISIDRLMRRAAGKSYPS